MVLFKRMPSPCTCSGGIGFRPVLHIFVTGSGTGWIAMSACEGDAPDTRVEDVTILVGDMSLSQADRSSGTPPPKKSKFSIPRDLMCKRVELQKQIEMIISNVKELKRIENEEYDMSEKCGVKSLQSEADTDGASYIECPMPALGTYSTYSGPMASVWAVMPRLIAEAFCYD